ncbi:hypothetical protein HK096_010472 [Nowakowskiella sp. JEL0078]|nr:hypothetical protein HK096_010472 [Nowakowskiella sp. JEL0078]
MTGLKAALIKRLLKSLGFSAEISKLSQPFISCAHFLIPDKPRTTLALDTKLEIIQQEKKVRENGKKYIRMKLAVEHKIDVFVIFKAVSLEKAIKEARNQLPGSAKKIQHGKYHVVEKAVYWFYTIIRHLKEHLIGC